MTWSKFSLGFLAIVLLSFGKSQITEYWVPIEFSFFLIFLIIRNSSMQRALLMTFVLSVGLDIIFQIGHVKGLSAMGQLVMVFFLIEARRYVIPAHTDLFLVGCFSLFYLGNYYITGWISGILGIQFQEVPLVNLLFFSLFHTVLFGVLTLAILRIKRGRK